MKLEFVPILSIAKTFYQVPLSLERFEAYIKAMGVYNNDVVLVPMIGMNPMAKPHVAEKIDERGDTMVFYWDGSQQAARLVALKEDHYVRFSWLDLPEALYFEFRIELDEITGDLALIITDFVEDGDKESARLLWDNQINKLRKAIGS